MSLIEHKVTEMLDILASSSSDMGGGGASALVGSIGTALAAMVGNLTSGKEKYAQYEDDIQRLLSRAEDLSVRLLQLVDEDSEEFQPLAAAFAIPKDDPTRETVLETALMRACKVPAEIMVTAADSCELFLELAEKSSIISVSDAGVGAQCCRAALYGAALNIFANTRLMKDTKRAESLESLAYNFINSHSPEFDEAYISVMHRLQTGRGSADKLLGKPVAEAIDTATIEKVKNLKYSGVTPTLAIVRLGERPDDISYEKSASKKADVVGVSILNVNLSDTVTQDELLHTINKLNASKKVHGILLLRPLPKKIDDNTVRNALSPDKDVDGVTDAAMAGVFTGTPRFVPCTAEAVLEMLDYYKINCAGKKVVVVGRSLVIGRPVAMRLMERNATVTICHSHTKNLSRIVRDADIVVAAAGKVGVINSKCLSEGQIVIDVGVNIGTNGRLCGDVDYIPASDIVAGITPVPGGVGAVTTALLMRNVTDAAERLGSKKKR